MIPTVETHTEPQIATRPSHSQGLALDNAVPLDHGLIKKSWPHLVAGASGGMATALLTSPLDVLRTRLQSDFYRSQIGPDLALRRSSSLRSFHLFRTSLRHFRETFQILSSIRRLEGWPGLFRGLGPNLTGVVPASAIKFYTYGNCKRIVSEETNWSNDAAVVHIIAAATSGIVTGTATNPIWLVKTRLQLDRSHAEKANTVTARRYKNSFDCVRQVLRQEGFRGMYRGLGASYLGAAESTLHLALYEQMKILLARRAQRVEVLARDKTTWDQAADWFSNGGAAGISKLIAVSIGYPHEVVRTRLRQASMHNGQRKYTGLIQCFRLIWKDEGLVSLYGGFTPHLLRSVPSAAITLGVYEFVLNVLDTQSVDTA
ncbi:MAG: hypothetical protein M1817_003874 [Caeruleum heppii]|nr:MAG: hypothetical protein M1817_003874 [Caeruleum heppii]